MINPAVFKKTYEDYSRMVYNLCLNYLHNSEEAEEATQDVFVKVYQKLDSFNQSSSLKTWIYRIAINQCLDIIKARKRQKRFGFRVSLTDKEEMGIHLPDFNHPGIQLENREALENLMRAIQDLPDKQQTALILKHIEGQSQKEIADIMKLSVKAVESLLQRGKNNLRKNLDASEGKRK